MITKPEMGILENLHIPQISFEDQFKSAQTDQFGVTMPKKKLVKKMSAKEKAIKQYQDELDKKLQKVLKYTPASYQQKLI